MNAAAQRPRISLAMATYNGERYLNQQLASLVAQSYLPAELIIIDDHSSDGTPLLIDQFMATAPFPVTYFPSGTRLGYRTRFIEAAAACSGDIIAFCDQDDIWRNDKLALIADRFEKNQPLLAYHNARLADKHGAPFGETFPDAPAHTFHPLEAEPYLIVPGFSQAVSHRLAKFTPLHTESVDPLNARMLMAHDQFFFFWASVFGDIEYIPTPLADYRQHENNVFGWHRHNFLADTIRDILFTPPFLQGATAAATNRSHLLKRAVEKGLCTAEQVDMAARAMAYYDTLARDLRLRTKLYLDTKFAARISTFVQLVRTGAYRHDGTRRFGIGPVLMDIFIGVPFGRLLGAWVTAAKTRRADARSASRTS